MNKYLQFIISISHFDPLDTSQLGQQKQDYYLGQDIEMANMEPYSWL